MHLGLVMELHPKILESGDAWSTERVVTFVCKYRAPEPLTIKFYFEGREMPPPKWYNESRLFEDSWRGEHSWSTVWDTRRQGEVYECRTITERGFTLGVLTTTLPEKGRAIGFVTGSLPVFCLGSLPVRVVAQ